MSFLHIYKHFGMTPNSGFTAVFEGKQVAEKPGCHRTLTDWVPTSIITAHTREPHRDGRWNGGPPPVRRVSAPLPEGEEICSAGSRVPARCEPG